MHAPLLANMGIQLIFGEWLLVACELIPVIGIETFVVHRYTALSIRKDCSASQRPTLFLPWSACPSRGSARLPSSWLFYCRWTLQLWVGRG